MSTSLPGCLFQFFFVLQTIVLVLAFDKLLCNRLNFKVEMKRERTAFYIVHLKYVCEQQEKMIQESFKLRLTDSLKNCLGFRVIRQ